MVAPFSSTGRRIRQVRRSRNFDLAREGRLGRSDRHLVNVRPRVGCTLVDLLRREGGGILPDHLRVLFVVPTNAEHFPHAQAGSRDVRNPPRGRPSKFDARESSHPHPFQHELDGGRAHRCASLLYKVIDLRSCYCLGRSAPTCAPWDPLWAGTVLRRESCGRSHGLEPTSTTLQHSVRFSRARDDLLLWAYIHPFAGYSGSNAAPAAIDGLSPRNYRREVRGRSRTRLDTAEHSGYYCVQFSI